MLNITCKQRNENLNLGDTALLNPHSSKQWGMSEPKVNKITNSVWSSSNHQVGKDKSFPEALYNPLVLKLLCATESPEELVKPPEFLIQASGTRLEKSRF